MSSVKSGGGSRCSARDFSPSRSTSMNVWMSGWRTIWRQAMCLWEKKLSVSARLVRRWMKLATWRDGEMPSRRSGRRSHPPCSDYLSKEGSIMGPHMYLYERAREAYYQDLRRDMEEKRKLSLFPR